MTDLIQRIVNLTDQDAIESANYVTYWMLDEVQCRGRLPEEILNKITNNKDAIELLIELFPEQSISLQEAFLTEDIRQQGHVARRFLVVLAKRKQFAFKVLEALDKPRLLLEPLTTIAIASGIVFFLSLEFEFEYENIEGKRKFRWRIHHKGTQTKAVTDLLGFLNK